MLHTYLYVKYISTKQFIKEWYHPNRWTDLQGLPLSPQALLNLLVKRIHSLPHYGNCTVWSAKNNQTLLIIQEIFHVYYVLLIQTVSVWSSTQNVTLFFPKTAIVAYKDFSRFPFLALFSLGGSTVLGKGSVWHSLTTTYLSASTPSAPFHGPSNPCAPPATQKACSPFLHLCSPVCYEGLFLPIPPSNISCPNSPNCLRHNLNATHYQNNLHLFFFFKAQLPWTLIF